MSTSQLLLNVWDRNVLLIAGCVGALFAYAILCDLKFSGRSFFFLAADLLFFLALDSPINALARGFLFSAHMVQHLLLVLIVPPLLWLGMPPGGKKRLIAVQLPSWARHPWVGWVSGTGAMWFWHVPAFCDAAATNEAVHTFQTFSLLGMGLLFWKPIVGSRIEERLSPLPGILYLFTACLACTLLGIWISFSPVSVCPVFMSPVDQLGLLPLIRDQWHLTPVIDQQIGGLLMWVPTCLVYLGAILVLLGRLYRRPHQPPQPSEKRKK